jgi:hypothetical protein
LISQQVTCWHLRDARNGVRHGETSKRPSSIAERIKAYVEMVEVHLLEPSSKPRRETIATPKWSPPRGTVFVNVDLGFFSWLVFFTGGHRNFRLPQNLENLANFLEEIIQTNFEFEFF